MALLSLLCLMLIFGRHRCWHSVYILSEGCLWWLLLLFLLIGQGWRGWDCIYRLFYLVFIVQLLGGLATDWWDFLLLLTELHSVLSYQSFCLYLLLTTFALYLWTISRVIRFCLEFLVEQTNQLLLLLNYGFVHWVRLIFWLRYHALHLRPLSLIFLICCDITLILRKGLIISILLCFNILKHYFDILK